MLQGEHSAILLTFIKLPFRSLVCLFLSGHLRQVLLYFNIDFVWNSVCAESQKWNLPFDELDLSIIVITKHFIVERQ